MRTKAAVDAPQINEIDRKILLALLKDARSNFADIARDCQVSIAAISQRFKKMKKKQHNSRDNTDSQCREFKE